MAHFYAEIQGSRGQASRCGSESSGIWGHIRGWNIGAEIVCGYDSERKEDYVDIYLTRGSSGRYFKEKFDRIYESDLEESKKETNHISERLFEI